MQEINNTIDDLPSLDRDLSIQLVAGNSNLAENLTNTMLESLPNEQKIINNYFNNQQLDKLREQVHRLYGGCCYTGLIKLKYIVRNLEQAIIKNNQTNIVNYIKILNKELDYLIKNFLNK